ncbi:ribulose-phosphate 3-epimerase [Candidatus Babeliales bacterium]|nr:ribulose-phosphate 3-epimerase [Candidatus Babeliales bacterium]
MKSIRIFPSLMAADPLHLGDVIENLREHCDGFHIDVMDDHFVPNISMGPMTVNKMAEVTKKPLFVQLMVDNPDQWIERLKLKDEAILAVHIESTKALRALLQKISGHGWKPYLAVSPKTNIETVYPWLDMVAGILIMAVTPGFAGQDFIPSITAKARELISYKKQHKLPISIAIDGGIDLSNINQLANMGIDTFCIGSGIFDHDDHVKALQDLYTAIKK